MSLFVDTSVWSLALRRDVEKPGHEVEELAAALMAGQPVFTTGLVLQELLQGFRGPKDREAILARFDPPRPSCATTAGVVAFRSVRLMLCWRSSASAMTC